MITVKNKEERLINSEKFNTNITERALLIAHKTDTVAKVTAIKYDGCLWSVRDIEDPNNHKKTWCTRTELITLFNKLMDQGYSISIC